MTLAQQLNFESYDEEENETPVYEPATQTIDSTNVKTPSIFFEFPKGMTRGWMGSSSLISPIPSSSLVSSLSSNEITLSSMAEVPFPHHIHKSFSINFSSSSYDQQLEDDELSNQKEFTLLLLFTSLPSSSSHSDSNLMNVRCVRLGVEASDNQTSLANKKSIPTTMSISELSLEEIGLSSYQDVINSSINYEDGNNNQMEIVEEEEKEMNERNISTTPLSIISPLLFKTFNPILGFEETNCQCFISIYSNSFLSISRFENNDGEEGGGEFMNCGNFHLLSLLKEEDKGRILQSNNKNESISLASCEGPFIVLSTSLSKLCLLFTIVFSEELETCSINHVYSSTYPIEACQLLNCPQMNLSPPITTTTTYNQRKQQSSQTTTISSSSSESKSSIDKQQIEESLFLYGSSSLDKIDKESSNDTSLKSEEKNEKEVKKKQQDGNHQEDLLLSHYFLIEVFPVKSAIKMGGELIITELSTTKFLLLSSKEEEETSQKKRKGRKKNKKKNKKKKAKIDQETTIPILKNIDNQWKGFGIHPISSSIFPRELRGKNKKGGIGGGLKKLSTLPKVTSFSSSIYFSKKNNRFYILLLIGYSNGDFSTYSSFMSDYNNLSSSHSVVSNHHQLVLLSFLKIKHDKRIQPSFVKSSNFLNHHSSNNSFFLSNLNICQNNHISQRSSPQDQTNQGRRLVSFPNQKSFFLNLNESNYPCYSSVSFGKNEEGDELEFSTQQLNNSTTTTASDMSRNDHYSLQNHLISIPSKKFRSVLAIHERKIQFWIFPLDIHNVVFPPNYSFNNDNDDQNNDMSSRSHLASLHHTPILNPFNTIYKDALKEDNGLEEKEKELLNKEESKSLDGDDSSDLNDPEVKTKLVNDLIQNHLNSLNNVQVHQIKSVSDLIGVMVDKDEDCHSRVKRRRRVREELDEQYARKYQKEVDEEDEKQEEKDQKLIMEKVWQTDFSISSHQRNLMLGISLCFICRI